MQFSVFDYPDDKFFNVTHKLLNNEPEHKKFRYTNKNKGDVQVNILNHINNIRRQYNLPPAFASWDSVPIEVLRTRVETQLAKKKKDLITNIHWLSCRPRNGATKSKTIIQHQQCAKKTHAN